ncbi:beta-glucoside-specific PTS transporter subunit IIABC [Bombilactobacillus thymidiniphilus]|uniref:Beta-glucoside-specific PTS transporter subunit IIABC n=1 Tax=Bombilactobacillus thymidiniphilus TaxID=2923363 RepID=A0ABY4PBD7_9LACO|nr:beta-glucoside-specific PTS transporter subunit IIABC [Bombilactobacillus thymidiniphilus]UQS83083.1 beta-glucoside-specific PTS transporter subunit IIABC [Bombilactobacillus thymidiniphilus]
MDANKLAKQILDLVGGDGNINAAWHCATRLRFTLKDVNKAKTEEIDNLDDVITVVQAGGQYQVVIGNDVGKVYDALVAIDSRLGEGQDDSTATADQPKSKWSIKGAFNGFVTFISGAFTPFLGAMAGAGILKGLLALFVALHWMTPKSGTYLIWYAAADGIFYFLPVVLAFTAAKQLKVNQFVSVAIAMALVYPTFSNTHLHLNFLSIPVQSATYTTTVIPILLVVVVQKFLEPLFDKFWHESVRNILTPLCLLMILVPLTLLIVGPISNAISAFLAGVVTILYKAVPALSGLVLGGLWEVFVIFGVHWAFAPVMMNNLQQFGYDPLMPILLPAVLSQAGAALGVFLKAKDDKMKGLAGSNVITAIFGITEPTVYGITLKLKKPFYCAVIGGGIGGAIVAFSGVHANVVGLASILSIPTFISKGLPLSLVGDAVAFILAAVLTYFFGGVNNKSTKDAAPKAATNDGETALMAPVKGIVLPLSDVNDQVFASEAMGKGIAIVPEDNVVTSPISGTISVAYPTGHAVGITGDDGVEVLLHLGIDTVNLNGEHFKMLVEKGQQVAASTPLIEFDYKAIKDSGYDNTVMMIITNSKDYDFHFSEDTQADNNDLIDVTPKAE